MKPLTIEIFEEYWHLVEVTGGKENSLPWPDLIYDEWESEFAGKCFGTRHRLSGEKHGIVRWILPNGCIEESTWKNGQWHGLSRIIESDEIKIILRAKNLPLNEFTFNSNFDETYRKQRNKHLLDNLTPAYFSKITVTQENSETESDSEEEESGLFENRPPADLSSYLD